MVWQKVFYNNIATYISLINEELKEEFPLEPLSNHIKVLGGYAFKAAEYRDSGIPVIRISDFQDEQIDLSGVRYFREDKVFDRFRLYAGDIIIAMTGGTIGKLAIVQDGLGKLYLNQRVGKFQVLNKDEFVPEYVYWLARGIQDKVKNLGYGGAQPNVSNGQIEALEFAFPNRKVQLRIIEFLNDLRADELKPKTYFNASVEDRILQFQSLGVNVFTVLEECDQQQTYLELLRQTILQEAVKGKLTKQLSSPSQGEVSQSEGGVDEPATELLKRIKAEKEKLIKAGKLKKEKELPPITADEIPFELPEGWVWCRLGDASISRDGERVPLSTEVRKTRQGIYDYYGAQGVIDNIDDFLFDKSLLLIAEDGGNLLRRSKEVAYFAHGKYWVNNHAHVVDAVDFTTLEYLKIFINSVDLKPYLNGEPPMQIKLNQGKLNIIPVPLPPLAEQQRIVAKVQQLQQQLSQLGAQVQQSRQYARQLLQSVLKEAFEQKGKVYEMEEEGTLNMVAVD